MLHTPTQTSAQQTLSRAKLEAVREFPFFGMLVLSCECVEDAQTHTLWADGRRIGYNANFVQNCQIPELVWLLCHEALHNAFGHGFRMGARDAQLHNLATDFWVNGVLSLELKKRPHGRLAQPNLARITGDPEAALALDLERFANPKGELLSSDAIYALLVRESLEKPNTGGAKSDDSDSSEEDEENGGSSNPNPENNQGGLEGDLQPQNAEDRSSAAQEAGREFWKAMLSKAAQTAQDGGHVPEMLRRQLEEMIQKRVPWQEALANFIQPTPADYLWQQPDRRFSEAEFILPDVGGNRLEVVICLDTSGSVSGEMLNYFAAETQNILATFDQVQGHLIGCDEALTYYLELDAQISSQELHLEHLGGGRGTSFIPPFEFLERKNIVPHALVYFTDGLGSFPKTAPEFPVLWVMVDSLENAPFGEVLRIKL